MAPDVPCCTFLLIGCHNLSSGSTNFHRVMKFGHQVTNFAGANLKHRVTLVPSGAGVVCHMSYALRLGFCLTWSPPPMSLSLDVYRESEWSSPSFPSAELSGRAADQRERFIWLPRSKEKVNLFGENNVPE